MQKLVILAIVAGLGYALYQGLIASPRKPSPPAAPADPIADMAARLKAEQERLRAEEDARGRASQPVATPGTPRVAAAAKVQDPRLPGFSDPDPCATARNNVQVTSNWMQQGGTVYEKGSGKVLSQNDSFDAAARNRQYIEDNCRRR